MFINLVTIFVVFSKIFNGFLDFFSLSFFLSHLSFFPLYKNVQTVKSSSKQSFLSEDSGTTTTIINIYNQKMVSLFISNQKHTIKLSGSRLSTAIGST